EMSAFMVAKLSVIPPASMRKAPQGLGWEAAVRLLGPTIPGLLRDVFGPSPHGRASFDPAWRGTDVVTLTEQIYHDRAFTVLPDLAEALEEAGCDDAGLLGHLRRAGPPVPGCGALDTVLGKS